MGIRVVTSLSLLQTLLSTALAAPVLADVQWVLPGAPVAGCWAGQSSERLVAAKLLSECSHQFAPPLTPDDWLRLRSPPVVCFVWLLSSFPLCRVCSNICLWLQIEFPSSLMLLSFYPLAISPPSFRKDLWSHWPNFLFLFMFFLLICSCSFYVRITIVLCHFFQLVVCLFTFGVLQLKFLILKSSLSILFYD